MRRSSDTERCTPDVMRYYPIMKTIISIVVVLVLLAGAYVLWPMLRASQTETPSPTPVVSPRVGESRTYTSTALGISFQYISRQTEDVTFAVRETGDRISIYNTKMTPEDGQFVKRFTKKTDETFKESIQRQILAGYTGDCTIELSRSNIISTAWIAEIGYPEPTNPDDAPWANAKYCNDEYAKTNGIRYFLYEDAYPDRFYYFDIGQYSIFGHDEIPWQYTIELF